MTTHKNVEVEVRALLSKQEYDRLLIFFKEVCDVASEDRQETHYLDAPVDIRIQKNTKTAKIWLKKGEMHDPMREEIEVHCHRDDFPRLVDLFSTIGLKTKVKWLRTRNTFLWGETTVCLDHTAGYGHILELERMAHEKDKEAVLADLRGKLAELEILETPKEEFKQKYEHYLQHWETLILEGK